MEIKKSEATFALMAIDAAAARSAQLQRYRRFAPFLILLGAIWLLANGVSELAPYHSGTAWLSLSLMGAVVSYWIGRRQHAAFDLDSAVGERSGLGGRWALCLILLGYYGVHSHYFLYMGCVSGGALIAGGLWLRRL